MLVPAGSPFGLEPAHLGEAQAAGRLPGVHVDEGEIRTVQLDESGWFELRPGPSAAFRLGVRTAESTVVLTERITP